MTTPQNPPSESASTPGPATAPVSALAPANAPAPTRDHYRALHAACGAILELSLTDPLLPAHAQAHAFLTDLGTWHRVLEGRKESVLLVVAARELQFALLAAVTGMYRQAFVSLRLTLELGLAMTYYSGRDLRLREWLDGRRDNVWAKIVNDDNGVLSIRFADAYCPTLREVTLTYNTLAKKVYRECSEYVHADAHTHDALPRELTFDHSSLALWQEKARTVSLVLSFALYLRYAGEMSADGLRAIEHSAQEHLGHLQVVRDFLGNIASGV